MAEWVVYRTNDGKYHAVPYENKKQADTILDRADVTAGAAPVFANTADEAIEKTFGDDALEVAGFISRKRDIQDDLQKRFTYHAPKGNQQMRYEHIRKYGFEMAVMLINNCPDSRERSLSLTRIEEAVMWANAAIARNE
jgi:hypothetical protein